MTTFDDYAARIAAGGTLTEAEIRELAASPDVLPLGMLADTAKRARHGARVTFLRVSFAPLEGPVTVEPSAREVRLTGVPASMNAALQAVSSARAAAGARTLSAFAWPDIEQIASGDIPGALEQLRGAGLDALAELPLDVVPDAAAALDQLSGAGFQQARLTLRSAAGGQRLDLLLTVEALRSRFPILKALNPLPLTLNAFRPTTGYDDVKTVALARLAAPTVACVQVDWPRYGPKLAQVALSFGADDVDGISASDDASEGRRRAPLEEIRRNIEAAGFAPVERDGRYRIAEG